MTSEKTMKLRAAIFFVTVLWWLSLPAASPGGFPVLSGTKEKLVGEIAADGNGKAAASTPKKKPSLPVSRAGQENKPAVSIQAFPEKGGFVLPGGGKGKEQTKGKIPQPAGQAASGKEKVKPVPLVKLPDRNGLPTPGAPSKPSSRISPKVVAPELPRATAQKALPAPGGQSPGKAGGGIPIVKLPGGGGFVSPGSPSKAGAPDSQKNLPKLPAVTAQKMLPNPAAAPSNSAKGAAGKRGLPVLPPSSLGKVLEKAEPSGGKGGGLPVVDLPTPRSLKGAAPVLEAAKGAKPGLAGTIKGVPEGVTPILMGRVVVDQHAIRGDDPRYIHLRVRNSTSSRLNLAEVRLWKPEGDESAYLLDFADLEPGTAREARVWIGRSPDGTGEIWSGLMLEAGQCLEGRLRWLLEGERSLETERFQVCPEDRPVIAGYTADIETLAEAVRPRITDIRRAVVSEYGYSCLSARLLNRLGMTILGHGFGERVGRVEVIVGTPEQVVINEGIRGVVNIESWRDDKIFVKVENVDADVWGRDPVNPRDNKIIKIGVIDADGNGIGIKTFDMCPQWFVLDIEVVSREVDDCRWSGLSGLGIYTSGLIYRGEQIREVASEVIEEVEPGLGIEHRIIVRGVKVRSTNRSVQARYYCFQEEGFGYEERARARGEAVFLMDQPRKFVTLRIGDVSYGIRSIESSVRIESMRNTFNGLEVRLNGSVRPGNLRVRLAPPYDHVSVRPNSEGVATIHWPIRGVNRNNAFPSTNIDPSRVDNYVVEVVDAAGSVLDRRLVSFIMYWEVGFTSLDGGIEIVEYGDEGGLEDSIPRSREMVIEYHLLNEDGMIRCRLDGTRISERGCRWRIVRSRRDWPAYLLWELPSWVAVPVDQREIRIKLTIVDRDVLSADDRWEKVLTIRYPYGVEEDRYQDILRFSHREDGIEARSSDSRGVLLYHRLRSVIGRPVGR